MTPVFDKNIMRDKYGHDVYYHNNPAKRPVFPALYFYGRLAAGPVQWLFRKAAKGQCDDFAWTHAAAWVGDILDDTGMVVEIAHLSAVDDKPAVFIANHMSTLETFLLPAMIRPLKPVTFVVKESLVKLPLFGPVMRSRKPIVVKRVNPREDLVTVLEEGVERLSSGVSIVVFPQSTRSLYFSRNHFNSIGIKLARKANVPVVPLALKTDAWGAGGKIRELGRIRPDLPVRFHFGEPMTISGTGKKEHEEVCNFIEQNLVSWQNQDGVNK